MVEFNKAHRQHTLCKYFLTLMKGIFCDEYTHFCPCAEFRINAQLSSRNPLMSFDIMKVETSQVIPIDSSVFFDQQYKTMTFGELEGLQHDCTMPVGIERSMRLGRESHRML